MNANDPGGYDKKLPRQEKLLNEATIDPDDEDPDGFIPQSEKALIEEFKVHRLANADIKDHTLADDLKHLRLTVKRADVLLSEMEQSDFNRFVVDELNRSRGLATGTINQYKRTLRLFFDWLGRNWADSIEFEDTDRSPPPPEQLFSMSEINRMLEEGDTRGKAILALYADTGWRLSAIASLTIGRVELKDEVAKIYINEDAHVKDAEGGTPLSFSRGYVASYKENEHPRPDDEEVAFIHKEEQWHPDDDGALCTDRIRTIVYDMAEEAGFDRDRVTVHIFRHSAVRRLKRQGVSRETGERRFKWAPGSKMWDWYGEETEEEKVEDQAVELGLIDRDDIDDEDAGPTTKDCSVCHTTLPIDARHCHACGTPQTSEAAEEAAGGDVQDPEETAEDLAENPDVLAEMDTAAVLEALIKINPDLLQEIDIEQFTNSDAADS